MREIKFRAQRTLNGSWVYGSLLIKQKARPIHETSETYKNYYIVTTDELGYFENEVDPDTISQYTGLKDCNGKDIYEDDIVFILSKSAQVAFLCGEFVLLDFVSLGTYVGIGRIMRETSDIKVIGNIHDNPELLESQ